MPAVAREGQVGSGWARLFHSLSDVVLNYLFELQSGAVIHGAIQQSGRSGTGK